MAYIQWYPKDKWGFTLSTDWAWWKYTRLDLRGFGVWCYFRIYTLGPKGGGIGTFRLLGPKSTGVSISFEIGPINIDTKFRGGPV